MRFGDGDGNVNGNAILIGHSNATYQGNDLHRNNDPVIVLSAACPHRSTEKAVASTALKVPMKSTSRCFSASKETNEAGLQGAAREDTTTRSRPG